MVARSINKLSYDRSGAGEVGASGVLWEPQEGGLLPLICPSPNA